MEKLNSSTDLMENLKKAVYPSQVNKTAYGKGLFVTKDVPVRYTCVISKQANTVVEKFLGKGNITAQL